MIETTTQHPGRRSTMPTPRSRILAIPAAAALVLALASCTASAPSSAPAPPVDRQEASRPTPSAASSPIPLRADEIELAAGDVTLPFGDGRPAGRMTVMDMGHDDVEFRLAGFDAAGGTLSLLLLDDDFAPIEGCLPDDFARVLSLGNMTPEDGGGLVSRLGGFYDHSVVSGIFTHMMLQESGGAFPADGTCDYPIVAEAELTWHAR
jgi:hypothetical protein